MQAFQVPVHEVYGGHEFGCVASTCERQGKMHIMMAECLVESIRNGRHVASGELGEIVVTPFTNRVMPLIRYRPGELAGFMRTIVHVDARPSYWSSKEGWRIRS